MGAVKGIQSKLAAAGKLVPEKGWVLYPTENDREIPDELRESLEAKGLRLQPVSSVAEAIELLFDFPRAHPRKNPLPMGIKGPLRNNTLVLVLVCALVCLFALLFSAIHGWPPFEREIVNKTSLQDDAGKETHRERNTRENGKWQSWI